MSDSEEELSEKYLKIAFVGEQNVGKTSIIKRFCYDEYTRHYNQTLGADFYIKRVVLPGTKEVSIKITDIGGSELNGHMLSNYLYNTNMIILVYDITNISTFESMVLWIDSVAKFMERPMFVAAFGDLEHKRAVRLDKTHSFMEEYQLLHFPVSAKTGENVNSSIMDLLARHFGIPLSRIEREKQATIIKAELVQNTPQQTKTNTAVQSKSSVCSIQ